LNTFICALNKGDDIKSHFDRVAKNRTAILDFISKKLPDVKSYDIGEIYDRVATQKIVDRFMSTHKYLMN